MMLHLTFLLTFCLQFVIYVRRRKLSHVKQNALLKFLDLKFPYIFTL